MLVNRQLRPLLTPLMAIGLARLLLGLANEDGSVDHLGQATKDVARRRLTPEKRGLCPYVPGAITFGVKGG